MAIIPFINGFDKKKLQETEGIISMDRTYLADYNEDDARLFNQWKKAGRGMLAEYNVFKMLESVFGNQKCLLVGGFEEKKLLGILKEEIEKDLKRRKKIDNSLDMPFSEAEDFYYRVLVEDFEMLMEEVVDWVKSIPGELTQDTLIDKIENMTTKPGFSLMSEKNQTKYQDNLAGHFRTKMENRSKATYTKEEVKNCFLRFLLNKIMKNNEFDFLLFLPVIKSNLMLSDNLN